MKLRLFYLAIYTVLIAVSIESCYYDNADDLYPDPTDTSSIVDTNVYFSTDIQPYINNTCGVAGCHMNVSTNPDLITYADIEAQAARIKARAIDKTPSQMPPTGSGVSEEFINDFEQWLADGKPDN